MRDNQKEEIEFYCRISWQTDRNILAIFREEKVPYLITDKDHDRWLDIELKYWWFFNSDNWYSYQFAKKHQNNRRGMEQW